VSGNVSASTQLPGEGRSWWTTELRGAPRWGIALLALAVFALLYYQMAWLDDDCMITMRSVLHWLDGYGPNWNAAERVQTYTHPLWMLLMTGSIGITGEFFLTTIALGAVFSFAALFFVMLSLREPRSVLLVLVGAFASKAFFEYSSSGLENPLCYLLLAIFVVRYLGTTAPEQRLRSLMFVAGLSVLTRMDSLLFYAPALMALIPRVGLWRWIQVALLGFSPFLLWSAFAFFYYGSPFPITAYAKSFRHGIPQMELIAQSRHFFVDSLVQDPWTLPVIGLGLFSGLLARGRRAWLAVGGVLYLLYIVKIGGGFMSGRFFALPYWLALLLLVQALRGRALRWGMGFAGVALASWMLLHMPAQLFTTVPEAPRHDGSSGVTDEWRYYYARGGLHSPHRDFRDPYEVRKSLQHGVGDWGFVVVWEPVGLPGLQSSGPATHVIDLLLCDPLLARLPTYDLEDWRIGHWRRRLPDGYVESVTHGDNRIEDPRLHEFYEDLHEVIRGPLFSMERHAFVAPHLDGQARPGAPRLRRRTLPQSPPAQRPGRAAGRRRDAAAFPALERSAQRHRALGWARGRSRRAQEREGTPHRAR
jgi:arabinofuranosyltransferase